MGPLTSFIMWLKSALHGYLRRSSEGQCIAAAHPHVKCDEDLEMRSLFARLVEKTGAPGNVNNLKTCNTSTCPRSIVPREVYDRGLQPTVFHPPLPALAKST